MNDKIVGPLCLYKEIRNLIESRPKKSLVTIERRIDMADSLHSFVVRAVEKYYKGQEEHGGDLCDRDLDMERYHESIDQFWYSEADKWKKRRL